MKKEELELALDGLLVEMKPFLRMYHCPFDEVCDTDMAAAEKNTVLGNVQLVLSDPPYNTRRSRNLKNSRYDVLAWNLWHMKSFQRQIPESLFPDEFLRSFHSVNRKQAARIVEKELTVIFSDASLGSANETNDDMPLTICVPLAWAIHQGLIQLPCEYIDSLVRLMYDTLVKHTCNKYTFKATSVSSSSNLHPTTTYRPGTRPGLLVPAPLHKG